MPLAHRDIPFLLSVINESTSSVTSQESIQKSVGVHCRTDLLAQTSLGTPEKVVKLGRIWKVFRQPRDNSYNEPILKFDLKS